MKKKRLHCGTKFLRVLIFVIFLGSAKISSCKKEKRAGNIILSWNNSHNILLFPITSN